MVSDGAWTRVPESLLCCPSQVLRLLSLLLGPQLQLFLSSTPFPHPMGPVCAQMQWYQCVYPYLHKEDSLRYLSLTTCGPPTPAQLPGLICTGQFCGLCLACAGPEESLVSYSCHHSHPHHRYHPALFL